MKRRLAAWFSFCSLGIALLLSGCTDNQIGRACNNPLASKVTSGVTFVNPAPDCPTRLCMITPKVSDSTNALAKSDHRTNELSICTTECNTDDDCGSPYENDNRCGKYVCAVASVVPDPTGETFCCKKLCMCDADRQKGFNMDGNGASLPKDSFGVSIPPACVDPATACTLK